MSEVLFEIVDPNGILYPQNGKAGGKAVTMPIGSKIRQVDVDKGNFTIGGLDSLEKLGRVKKIKPETKTKIMPDGEVKNA